MLKETETTSAAPAPNRRQALVAAGSAFTIGYAAAINAAEAQQPITTDETGLVIEEVRYRAADDYRLPAYLARPAARGIYPSVIVVNEIFGIHAYIKDVCRRLAKLGYVAIAPDYFDRAGDPSTLTDFAEIRKIVDQASGEQVMADTAATLKYLQSRRDVADAKIGITGFCWGGTVVWRAAALVPGIKAGVAWYGRLVAPQQQSFGSSSIKDWPVDLAAKLKAPVLGLYAENDSGIPLTSVEAMRAALAAANNPSGSEIIVYPGTEHGFHADYRKQFNAVAASNGWAQLQSWFARHGVR